MHVRRYLLLSLFLFTVLSCNQTIKLQNVSYPKTSGDPEAPAGGCTVRSQPNKYPSLSITPSANPVCNGWHPACSFIQNKYSQGEAAGNSGDLYQNIDGNHARVSIESFPQVEELPTVTALGQFGPLANLDSWNRLGSVVLSNGSYVISNSQGTYSAPRFFFHRPTNWMGTIPGVEKAIKYFENNVHIWHPEHQDFDDYNKFFTHLPAISLSQGSSGSELDEMLHQYAILAAMKPEVKNWLRSRGLIMPVMLMVHRYGRAGNDAAYLEGSTHRGALDNVSSTAAIQMATLSNSITLDSIPPFSKIAVTSEGFNLSEQLFSNYQTLARLFTQNVAEQTIEVSAEDSYDVNCLPLSYTWKVLGGEFDTQGNRKVFIEQVQSGTWKKARIRIRPHTFVAPGTTATTSKMIYIGLFVNNGHYYSLPSFITISSDPTLVPTGY